MTSSGVVARMTWMVLVALCLLQMQSLQTVSGLQLRNAYNPGECRGYMEVCKNSRGCCSNLICTNLGNGVCVPELEVCVCRPKRSIFNL